MHCVWSPPKLTFLIFVCRTKSWSINLSVYAPNFIPRHQIRKNQILSCDIKFGETKLYPVTSNSEKNKLYPVTSNSEKPNSILGHQIRKNQILSCDIKLKKKKWYPATPNLEKPNSILRHQIRTNQIRFCPVCHCAHENANHSTSNPGTQYSRARPGYIVSQFISRAKLTYSVKMAEQQC